MKILRCCLILVILGLSSSVALANGIPDPKIGMGPTGSDGSFSQSQCTIPNVEVPPPPFCSFTTDANGSAIIDITNDLEAFIVKDTVTIDTAFTGGLICEVLESAHGWTTGPAVGNSCIFNGGFISPNFPYGLHFSLFDPNKTFFFDLQALTAATVPEPGAIILLGTGLAAVAAGRKRLKGAKHIV